MEQVRDVLDTVEHRGRRWLNMLLRSLVVNGIAACLIVVSAHGCSRSEGVHVPRHRLAVERPLAVVKLPPIESLTKTTADESASWTVVRDKDCMIEFEGAWPNVEYQHPFIDVTIEQPSSKGHGAVGTSVLYPKRKGKGAWNYSGDVIVLRRPGKYRLVLTNRRVKPPATVFVGSIEVVDH